jgi:SPASM domain peptide maturase of grasp-with-spasm system
MTYFSLLPTTIITIGYKLSCLFDMEKSFFCQIPNSMAQLINNEKSFITNDFLMRYEFNDREIIQEYIDFLLKNNFAIKTEHKTNFKYFSEYSDFCTPYHLNSLLIDSNSEENLLYNLSLISKNKIYIASIQIRMFFNPTIFFIKNLMEQLFIYNYKNIELILNYNSNFDYKEYEDLFNDYSSLLAKLIIMGCNINKLSKNGRIIYNIEQIVSNRQCGKISKRLFMTNISSYIHSCKGNSCLLKKISVDIDGTIKNCPSMKHHYGHISETNLLDVVSKPEFRKWWYYKKDDIDVCQDCEFRHICTDCRAFIKDPNNILSQPAKCGYNPYIAKWQGQDGWISVEQWRKENPGWEEKAKANRASYKTENCEKNLEEEKGYFNNL